MNTYAHETQMRASPRLFEAPAHITDFMDLDECYSVHLPTSDDSPLVDTWGDTWEYDTECDMWMRVNVSSFARTASRMHAPTLVFYYGPLRHTKEI